MTSLTRRRGVSSRLVRLLGIGLLVGASACSAAHHAVALPAPTASAAVGTPAVPAAGRALPKRPNIVYVLTDDLSSDLVQYMPHVVDLRKQGTSFTSYFVTDSLCCPSRTSIFTGEFPHNSKVFTNVPPGGGAAAFSAHGDQQKSFAVQLQKAGYRTAMMGKYLNGYDPRTHQVPPGWSEWDVAGNGYPEFNYNLTNDDTVKHFGTAPKDYLTDVLSTRADAFVRASAAARTPFMLEVATFAPHMPYTPAPVDAASFPGVQAARDPSFNTANTDAPSWLAPHQPLTDQEVAKIDADFRLRVQSVQAVDRLLASLETTLAAAGVANDTYVVFNSDNGFHLGQHELNEGKLTAFDSDIRVPLIVAGPGVARGASSDRIVENIDLAPTFEQLAGVRPQGTVDGHSIVALLLGRPPGVWRTAALVEHHGPDFDATDPDVPIVGGGDPATYAALRLPTALFVSYRNGEREFYDLTTDPYEQHNVWASLAPERQAALQEELVGLQRCVGATSCWAAAHVL